MELEECRDDPVCTMLGGVALCARDEEPDIELTWQSVPGGSFAPGAVHLRAASELTVLGDFELAEREVTNATFWQCTSDGICSEPYDCHGLEREQLFQADLPVVCVNALQAEPVCAYAGGRLPSDLEWEYAMRNGGQDVEFPWGDALMNCERAVVGQPPEGGSCPWSGPISGCNRSDDVTEQGVCDLVGNVAEWVRVLGASSHYERRGSNHQHENPAAVYAPTFVESGSNDTLLGVRCARDVSQAWAP
jgi:formylglycine-generating enzyme required for sulfatase activity